jgi:hypothetical protein
MISYPTLRKRRRHSPIFIGGFLHLKTQAREVSDDQVIAYPIKALRAGPLHSHVVRERLKTVPKLYEQFAKFSKYEIQHFRKLEQQRNITKPDEAPRPRYNKNQRSYPKPMHSIDSNGCGPSENWEKNFGHLCNKHIWGPLIRDLISTTIEVAQQTAIAVVAEALT